MGILQNHFESFLEKFEKINQGAAIFKSFETDAADQTEISFMVANIQQICHNIISYNPNATESEFTTILFQKLSQMTKTFDLIEYNTRNQSNSSLWFDMRKRPLTASRHHDIYRKVNTLAQSQGTVKSKTTSLFEKILFPEKPSVTDSAIKQGINHLDVPIQNTLTNTKSSKLKKVDCLFLKTIHISLLHLMVL